MVVLLNEIEQLLYYQEGIENIGAKENKFSINPRIEYINSLFPDTFCVFEKIVVQRLFYFMIFNIASCVSMIFSNTESIDLHNKMLDIIKHQKEISDLSKDVHKLATGGDPWHRKPLSTGFANVKPLAKVM